MAEFESLLPLLIVAIGIGVILFGAAGVGKLFGLLLAPLGCLLKAAALAFVAALIGLWLLSEQFDPGSGIGGQGGSSANTPSTAPASTAARLAEYPVLAQRDSTNYYPTEFADQLDLTVNEPVRNLACLATVYVMLRRGRGESDAMISAATYDMSDGAINPGFVGADIAFDGLAAAREIREGRPVVLHGLGGPLDHHFMLLTGVHQGRDGRWVGEVNDPWTGQRVEIDLSEQDPSHPDLPSVRVTMMRMVN